MAKIKFSKTKGITAIKRKSVPVSSVAGEEYEKLHPIVFREIQKKNSEYAIMFRNAENIRVNSQNLSGHLKPEIENTIESLRTYCAKEQIEYMVDGINIFSDVLPLCLTSEEAEPPRAQRIKIKNGIVTSRKINNICFHPQSMLNFVGDILIFGDNFSETSVVTLIVTVFKMILSFFHASKIELDETCGKVILILYENSSPLTGMEKSKLIDTVKDRYPTLQDGEITDAIDKLEDYHCIDITDDTVRLIESIS